MLARIQNDLFDLGADLCFPDETKDARGRLQVTDAQVARLEGEIDTLNRELEPLRSFVLPGGSPAASYSASRAHHLAPRRAPDGGARREAGRERSATPRCATSIGCRIFCSSRRASPTTRASRDVTWVPGKNR